MNRHFMGDRPLFSTHDAMLVIRNYPEDIRKIVFAWDKNKILSVPVEDLVDELAGRYRLDTPVLRVDDRYVFNHGDAIIDMSRRGYDYGFEGGGQIRGETVTIAVPFSGDVDLFQFAPSTSSMPPRADIRGSEIHITVTDQALSPQAIQQNVSRVIENIQQYLGWLRKDTDPWNAQLPGIARRAIEERKAELLKRDNLVASLGIPMGPHASPAGLRAVSLERKPRPVTTPAPVPRTPFTPEPVVNSAQYDDVMATINRLATVIERSPQTFAGLGETSIRDMVLVNLNADFQRHATGETFNGSGKTDILLSENGKNAFIAECKIWGGAKDFLAAIDQIQSYSTWRDCKTALLIFSRNRNFSDVLKTIAETVENHPKFKRRDKIVSETETRYVFRHKNDDNKEMLIAICAFNIPA